MSKIIDNYVLVKSISNLGEFGEIHKANHLITNEVVSIKVLKIDKFIEDSQIRDMILNEIKVLKAIKSCNRVLRIHKMLKSNNHIYIVYEYCEDGSLQDMIDMGKVFNYEDNEIRQLFRNILESYEIISRQDIIHGNISSKSIQFKDGNVMFSDFVFCKDLNQNNQLPVFTDKILSSLPYIYKANIAPELLKMQKPSIQSDIYSLGMIFYDVVFHIQIDNQQAKRVIDLENIKVKATQQTRNLIKSMISEDPFMRPSISQILNDLDILQIYEDGPKNFPLAKKQISTIKIQKQIQSYEKALITNQIKSINQSIMKERNKIIFCSKLMNEMVQYNFDFKLSAICSFLLLNFMKKLNNQLLFVLEGESHSIIKHIPCFQNIFQGDYDQLCQFKEAKQSQKFFKIITDEGEQVFQKLFQYKQVLGSVVDIYQNAQLRNIIDTESVDYDYMNKKLSDYVEIAKLRANEVRDENELQCKNVLIHAFQIQDIMDIDNIFENHINQNSLDLNQQQYFENIKLQNIEKLKLLISERAMNHQDYQYNQQQFNNMY